MFNNFYTIHPMCESEISSQYHQFAKSEGIRGIRPSFVTESDIKQSYQFTLRKINRR